MSQIRLTIDHEQLRAFCARWQVVELALFGSVLRDDFGPDSDVDVMVRFAPNAPWSLTSWLAMQHELEVIFQRNVDLVERAAIEHSDNRFRKREILATAVLVDVA
jgi:predicted nucleotidyltransferase